MHAVAAQSHPLEPEIGIGLEEIIGLADESIENNNVTIEEMVKSAVKIFQKWID